VANTASSSSSPASGGLFTALHLKRADAEVTLIDRRNFHLFQPLLYQVATGALSSLIGWGREPSRARVAEHVHVRVALRCGQ
jgi:NADH dehydrogenase